MPYREDGNLAVFVESFCDIHGRFGDKVYRKKNNGQPWVYDYVYKPKYAPTILSRRSVCAVKAGAGVYNFCCETFLKVRRAGQYTVMINDVRLPMWLFKRKMLPFDFVAGEYEIKCYKADELYSERKVIVIDAEADLEEVYSGWYAEHLVEIIHFPDPRFRALRIYHRGVEMPFWVQYIVGKTESGIMYRSKCRERFVYSRKAYEHEHNANGDYFYTAQTQVMACWSAAAPEFRRVWEKYHIRWFDANYRKDWKIVKQHNLWSKLVFLAGGILGFDLEELSPDNWLPGVETLGDLLELCGMGYYGLGVCERNTPIFNYDL
jgi:hypothetical protein